MQLSREIFSGYNSTRFRTNKSIVCHAPFVNLNFEQNGNVRACCYNSKHVLGTWGQSTIKEIWQGQQAELLRGYILEKNLGGGCSECGKMLLYKNYQGARARYYDPYASSRVASAFNSWMAKRNDSFVYPKVMEFELSNECNLECVMCNGYFSSSIRKNREQLAPLPTVYNNRFVDELEEFIPHLTDAKFLGGEPFMIDIYLKIWERILKIKPDIRIHITTNGTFLNSRVKTLLEGLNAGIILSMDSINPDTYKKIRVNGNLDKVMENLEYFREYTIRKKTFMSIAVCPITYNWREIPELMEFCIRKKITIYFNAVFDPQELSLRAQSAAYLKEVINYLEDYTPPQKKGHYKAERNLHRNTYIDFLNQLRGWFNEKKESEAAAEYSNHKLQMQRAFVKQEINDWTIEETRQAIKLFAQINGEENNRDNELPNRMTNLLIATPQGKVTEIIMFYFELLAQTRVINNALASDKSTFIALLIEDNPKREAILLQMAKASPLLLAEGFYSMSNEQLKEQLNAYFAN